MKTTLLKSTIILSVAALLSKILGSLFRIPLQNIAGDEVLGIFTLVYPVYMVALILSVAGIPIAISKLVAESKSRGDEQEVKDIFMTSGILAIMFGVGSFLLLYLFSYQIAEILGGSSTRPALIIVSATLLVAPYMAVYRGYFQGHENMAPTAVSQVIEQFIRVGLILLIAVYLVQNLYSDSEVAGGIMIGSIFGALGSLIYLRVRYRRSEVRVQKNLPYNFSHFKKTAKRILYISIPIAFGAITMALLNLVDSVTIPSALKAYENSSENVNYLYGIYGRGLAIVQIVTVFASSVILPLIPNISAKLAQNDHFGTQKVIEKTFFLTYLLSVPAASGLFALTYPINLGLFTDLVGSSVLAIISLSSLFTSLTILGTGVLQGINKARLAAWIIVAGVVTKVFLNVILVNLFGLDGAAISTAIVYLLLFLANIYFIQKHAKFNAFNQKTFIIVIASLLMAAIIGLPTLFINFELATRGFAMLYLIVAIATGAVIYLVLLFAGKVLNKELIGGLPLVNKFIK